MRKGFTLIELLVVIAIIAILAAILFPVFGKAREKARQTHCTNNQKQFATAVQMYTQEHEEVLPRYQTFWGDIRIDKAALKCLTKPSLDNGYVYNFSVGGLGLGEVRDPVTKKMKDAATVFLTADGEHTGTYGATANVATLLGDFKYRHNKQLIASFLDGHVEMVNEDRVISEQWLDASATTATTAFAGDEVTLDAGTLSTWAVTPAIGTAIPNGPTADITFPSAATYTVTATSTSDTSLVKTFTVVASLAGPTTSGMILWLKADTIAAGTTNVASWTDSSPAGNTVTWTSGQGATQPAYTASVTELSNKPAVQFRGGYLLRSTTDFQTPTNLHILVVMVPRAAGALADAIISCRNSSAYRWMFRGPGSNLHLHGSGAQNLTGFAPPLNAAGLATAKVTGTGSYTYTVSYNGSQKGTGAYTFNSGTPGVITIGGNSTDSNGSLDIAELIVYNRDLGTDETAVVNYLKTRYGITF